MNDIKFFSYLTLPPVSKPRPVHASSPSSALIGRLIEETLNPWTTKPTNTVLIINSL